MGGGSWHNWVIFPLHTHLTLPLPPHPHPHHPPPSRPCLPPLPPCLQVALDRGLKMTASQFTHPNASLPEYSQLFKARSEIKLGTPYHARSYVIQYLNYSCKILLTYKLLNQLTKILISQSILRYLGKIMIKIIKKNSCRKSLLDDLDEN